MWCMEIETNAPNHADASLELQSTPKMWPTDQTVIKMKKAKLQVKLELHLLPTRVLNRRNNYNTCRCDSTWENSSKLMAQSTTSTSYQNSCNKLFFRHLAVIVASLVSLCLTTANGEGQRLAALDLRGMEMATRPSMSSLDVSMDNAL